MSQITITVQLNGYTEWETDDLEGMDALGVMAGTLVDMFDFFFDKPDRPHLKETLSRVCIEFDGEALHVAYRPEADTVVAQGLVAAALIGLHRAVVEPDFDPLKVMLGAIRIPVEEE